MGMDLRCQEEDISNNTIIIFFLYNTLAANIFEDGAPIEYCKGLQVCF